MLEDEIDPGKAGNAEAEQQSQKTEDDSLHVLSNRSWRAPRPFRPATTYSALPKCRGRDFI
jgi:hypothetical protein